MEGENESRNKSRGDSNVVKIEKNEQNPFIII